MFLTRRLGRGRAECGKHPGARRKRRVKIIQVVQKVGKSPEVNPAAASRRVAAISAVALQPLASVLRIIRDVADDGFEDRGGVSTSV